VLYIQIRLKVKPKRKLEEAKNYYLVERFLQSESETATQSKWSGSYAENRFWLYLLSFSLSFYFLFRINVKKRKQLQLQLQLMVLRS